MTQFIFISFSSLLTILSVIFNTVIKPIIFYFMFIFLKFTFLYNELLIILFYHAQIIFINQIFLFQTIIFILSVITNNNYFYFKFLSLNFLSCLFYFII